MTATTSVVLPTLGDSGHLRQALRSALEQEGVLEILVVHDRRPGVPPLATDLAAGSARVRLLESAGRGLSSARNTGVDAARGELLAFLDDDDLFLPGHLRRAREVLGRHPRAAGAGAAALFFDDRSADASAPPPSDLADLERLGASVEGPVSLRELLLANRMVADAAVVRRDRLGDERFDPSLASLEDYDLWLRLVRGAPLVLDPRPGVLVRRRPGSMSRNLRVMAECAIEVIGRHAREGLPSGTLTDRELARRLGGLHHDLAYACLVEDDVAAARAALGESMRRVPLKVKNYAYAAVSLLPRRARRALRRTGGRA